MAFEFLFSLLQCWYPNTISVLLLLTVVLKKTKIPIKYKILWLKFIRPFLHLCIVDNFHGMHMYEQNKSSEAVWTEKVHQLSWDPACSNSRSGRESLNLPCLIFMYRKREKGHFQCKGAVKRETACARSPPARSVLAMAEHVQRSWLSVLSLIGMSSVLCCMRNFCSWLSKDSCLACFMMQRLSPRQVILQVTFKNVGDVRFPTILRNSERSLPPDAILHNKKSSACVTICNYLQRVGFVRVHSCRLKLSGGPFLV